MSLFLLPALLAAGGCSGKGDALSGRYEGSNLVVLIVDTLRADHLGCYGYPRPTTPRIDGLAGESLVFDNATVPIGITLPSHASILTGLYPQNTGSFRNYGRLDDRLLTLAEVLKDRGYRTGAVVGTAVLKSSKNLGQGFDAYLENFASREWVPGSKNQVKRRKGTAEDGLRLAREWIEEDPGRPFFLMVNLYDVHAPFILPPEFQGRFRSRGDDPEMAARFGEEGWRSVAGDPDKAALIDDYDAALAYTDAEIGKFLDALEREGLDGETIVVVTADHGEELYQHRDYASHGMYLYDGETRVPLLIRLPDRTRTGRVETVAESVDLFPSLLDLLGIRTEAAVDGVSMIPALEGAGTGKRRAFAMRLPEDERGRPLPRQFMVRDGDTKLIHTLGGETELYRLDRDPWERNDLAAGGGADARTRGLIRSGREWYREEAVDNAAAATLDGETAEDLRALGYLQ